LGQVLVLNFYKLTLEYDGRFYHGFQIQKNLSTIQGELHLALEKILLSKRPDFKVKSIGSGRTDAGVHAKNQIVKIDLPFEIPTEALIKGLNALLPLDIRVKGCETCPEDFHPIYHAQSKIYEYYFYNQKRDCAFLHGKMTKFNFDFDEERLQLAMNQFIGKHDFANYQCVGTEVEHTVREIYSFELKKFPSLEDHVFYSEYPAYYCMSIHGNGFLKQMVRLIVGASLNAARSKIKIDDIKESLNNPQVKKLGPTAPPEGLYLSRVIYP